MTGGFYYLRPSIFRFDCYRFIETQLSFGIFIRNDFRKRQRPYFCNHHHRFNTAFTTEFDQSNVELALCGIV
jgi:hypothetical protein